MHEIVVAVVVDDPLEVSGFVDKIADVYSMEITHFDVMGLDGKGEVIEDEDGSVEAFLVESRLEPSA